MKRDGKLLIHISYFNLGLLPENNENIKKFVTDYMRNLRMSSHYFDEIRKYI